MQATLEELDFRLTLATRRRKSADTHSSNDAAGAQARGEGQIVLLFPVLLRFIECGLNSLCVLLSVGWAQILNFAECPSI